MPKKTSEGKKTAAKANAARFHMPHGMHDVLPSAQPWWQKIRKTIDELGAFYNFHRIETPLLEPGELAQKGIGEQSEISLKRLYHVKARGEKGLVLRPEGTIPLLRAYLEHSLGRQSQPQRLFYEGPMFYQEPMGDHTYRQRTEAGFHIIAGQNDPLYDAQIILVFHHLLAGLKMGNSELKVNSLGCRVCRPFYRRQLQLHYGRFEKEICGDCARKLKINPLRLLACRKSGCAPLKERAPNFLDKICVACSTHFQRVLEYLDELKIEYSLDNHFFGRMDYYCRTVFGFFAKGYEENPLAEGGRYDYLMESLGSRTTPAVGGAVSYEYLLEAMKLQEAKLPPKAGKKVFVIHVGDLAKRKAVKLVEDLRAAGITAGEMFGKESLHAQLKIAEKEKYAIALILGQREIYEESVIMRDLESSVQETVRGDKIVEEIKKRLKANKQ